MAELPFSHSSLLVRTGFGRDDEWERIKSEVLEPGDDDFGADVRVIDDEQFADMDALDVIAALPPGQRVGVVFIVDREAIEREDHACLVVSLQADAEPRSFRAWPRAVGTIEVNLNLGNVSWSDCIRARDLDGICRGF